MTPRLIADAVIPSLPPEHRASARGLIEDQILPRMDALTEYRECPLEHFQRYARSMGEDTLGARYRALISFPLVIEIWDIAAEAEPFAVAKFIRERRIPPLSVARLGPNSRVPVALTLDDEEIARRAGILATRLAAWRARARADDISNWAYHYGRSEDDIATLSIGYVLRGWRPSPRLPELSRLAQMAGVDLPYEAPLPTL